MTRKFMVIGLVSFLLSIFWGYRTFLVLRKVPEIPAEERAETKPSPTLFEFVTPVCYEADVAIEQAGEVTGKAHANGAAKVAVSANIDAKKAFRVFVFTRKGHGSTAHFRLGLGWDVDQADARAKHQITVDAYNMWLDGKKYEAKYYHQSYIRMSDDEKTIPEVTDLIPQMELPPPQTEKTTPPSKLKVWLSTKKDNLVSVLLVGQTKTEAMSCNPDCYVAFPAPIGQVYELRVSVGAESFKPFYLTGRPEQIQIGNQYQIGDSLLRVVNLYQISFGTNNPRDVVPQAIMDLEKLDKVAAEKATVQPPKK